MTYKLRVIETPTHTISFNPDLARYIVQAKYSSGTTQYSVNEIYDMVRFLNPPRNIGTDLIDLSFVPWDIPESNIITVPQTIDELAKVSRIYQILGLSGYRMAPTGSRYLGGAREDSDWDFILEDAPRLAPFLGTLGFSNLFGNPVDSDYSIGMDMSLDCMTESIWEAHEGALTIQLQVTKKFDLKVDVRNVIKAFRQDEHFRMGTYQRAALWKGLGQAMSQP